MELEKELEENERQIHNAFHADPWNPETISDLYIARRKIQFAIENAGLKERLEKYESERES